MRRWPPQTQSKSPLTLAGKGPQSCNRRELDPANEEHKLGNSRREGRQTALDVWSTETSVISRWQIVAFKHCLCWSLFHGGKCIQPPFKVLVAQSWPTLCDPRNCSHTHPDRRLRCPRDSPGQHASVGGHSLLRGASWAGSKPGSPALQAGSYHLSRQRSPLYTLPRLSFIVSLTLILYFWCALNTR